MLTSIVHIESADKSNKSFGTGFVIDNDKHGAYILTCQHVLDEVGTAVIENQAIEVVATSNFLDMAVIHVKALTAPAFHLQLEACDTKDVYAIGFATFSKALVQKKQIQATLFDERIELHSKKDDAFYVVLRVKAKENYSFERGNSGAPLICKKSGAVIAMISNKEGSNIAYAIEIASLKEIWKKLNTSLSHEGSLHNHQHFYENINDFSNKVKENFQERKETVGETGNQLNNMDDLRKKLKKENKLKYYLSGILSILLCYVIFHFLRHPDVFEPENYKVVNIKKNNILNVRRDKGTVYAILGELPYDSKNVAVTKCESNDAGKEWCQITYGSLKGWVRSKYIEKESELYNDIENKSYFRTKNNKLFLQFTYPTSIKRGETILVSALLENFGAYEESGGVTLSFPQRPLLDYRVDYNDFSSLNQYKIFTEIYNNHENQKKKMNAIHPIIEANQGKWTKGEKHIFALSIVAPEDLNVFRIRVRGSLTLKRVIPNSGNIDQQGFFSKEIIIKIEK